MDSDEPSREGAQGPTEPGPQELVLREPAPRAFDQRLGREFRRLRESRALTQGQAGERLGYTQQWMQKVEAGKKIFSLELYLAFCRLYEVEPGSLLAGDWTASAATGFAEDAAAFEAAPPALSDDDRQVLAAYRAIKDSRLRASVLRILQAL